VLIRRLLLISIAMLVLAAVPASSSALGGKTITLTLGSSVVIQGRTGSKSGPRTVGRVIVRARWDGDAASFLLTTTQTDRHGGYRFTVRPPHRGVLRLQISPPDRHPFGYVLRIV
jgi:hypothetical protein